MRLLHLTDLHFRKPWFGWAAAHAGAYDCVALSGDLLDLLPTQKTRLAEQTAWVLGWIKTFPTQLCICSGNHDWWLPERLEDPDAEIKWLQRARRRGVLVDGDVQAIGGLRFAAAGWVSQVTVETAEPLVLVTHAPPERTDVSVSVDGLDAGDFEAREIAEQLPRGSLILSSHVHRPRRWHARVGETVCLNPGVTFGSAIPNHVEIDTTHRWARHHRDGQPTDHIRLPSR